MDRAGYSPTDPHTHRPQRPTRPTTRPPAYQQALTDHVPPMLRRDIGLPSYRPTVLPNLPAYRPTDQGLPSYLPDHTRLPTTAHVT